MVKSHATLAAIALAKPELCEALVAAKIGGLVVPTPHGPYDLTKGLSASVAWVLTHVFPTAPRVSAGQHPSGG